MFDVMLDFMLDRVHAMTHVILRAFSADDLSNQLSFARGEPPLTHSSRSRMRVAVDFHKTFGIDRSVHLRRG